MLGRVLPGDSESEIGSVLMTVCSESTQQAKMDPVTPSWKLTLTYRGLMWLQKKHPGAYGHRLQPWARRAFKDLRPPPLVSVANET
jgi:hypothetical protein